MIPLGILAAVPRATSTGAKDPLFASVGYLLHGDGTPGSTTFVDSGPSNATLTRSGTAGGGIIISDAWAQFGNGSILSPADIGNRLRFSTGSSGAASGNGGPWTWEASLYRTVGSSSQVIMDGNAGSSNTTGPAIYITPGNRLAIWDGSAGQNRGGLGSVIPVGSLCRIAVVWDGSQLRFYVEGVLDQTVSAFSNSWGGSVSLLGDQAAASQNYRGYIDEIRFTKAVRYTGGSYVLATEPFPNAGP